MTHRIHKGLLASCLLGFGFPAIANAETGAGGVGVDFDREIRPILSEHCFPCHGPDQSNRKPRSRPLRLDLRTDALEALSPGDPGSSEVLRRVRTTDPDDRMPPAEAKTELTAAEVALLEEWIRGGAAYEEHWAYRPLGPVAVPRPADPEGWVRNPVDAFVLDGVRRKGWEPRGEASKERLIRRVTFDLTGLPPTPGEVREFLADDREGAYERVVDRLLRSERYGERMATPWLDLARYADSYGYQVDRERSVWRWRDWVISAFNRNLPYDEFLTWQLAGDLLEDPTQEQLLATTFNRLHQQKVEGGSTPEEFRVEYVADRTRTFATAFLGLTMECARCHDHKYDPITQREYYRLFAFFNNIDEAGLYSFFTQSVPTPTLRLTDEGQRKRLAAAREAVSVAEAAEAAAGTADGFETWLGERPGEVMIAGELARISFDEKTDAGLPNLVAPDQPASTGDANRLVPGRDGLGQAIQLTGDDVVQLKVGNFRRTDPFSVGLWMWTPDRKERAVVFHRSRAWTDAASRGYELLIEDGRLSAALIHFWPGNAMRVRTRDEVPVGQWVHVTVTYNGSSRASGLRLYVDGKPAETEVVRDNLYKNITGGGGDHLAIGERFRDRGFTRGRVDDFRVFDRELTALEAADLHQPGRLVELLRRPAGELTEAERAELRDYHRSTVDAEVLPARERLRRERRTLCDLEDGLEEIMVMSEMADRRPTHVLRRGAYDAPGDPVTPGTPAFLPPFPEGAADDRLGLARWLTRPDHPLTARVTVNRFWQLLFGRGLVGTAEDFGSQGERPVYPRLLDWLANDFVESGWDVKGFMRKLVTSATYRQSSVAPADVAAADPENRWLARGPRHRLPAEMIRDNALAASGLLEGAIGGPPARPYEVAVSFKPVNADDGAGLYRRSLYTFWKVTGPAPVMMVLDAAKRDVCQVRRERTSSPLQALVLLNDPQFVEAARTLAEELVSRHGRDGEGIVGDAFLRLTSREPGEREVGILLRLLREQEEHFGERPEAALELLRTGKRPASTDDPERAPWLAAVTVLVEALLNYDECVVKR